MNDTEQFFCWLAGFVDGEGTISITVRGPVTMNRTYHRVYRGYLSIANTHAETMLYLKSRLDQHYGVNFGSLGRYSGKKVIHKDYYLLSVARFAHLEILLTDLLPFLVLKKQQATLVLEWVKSRRSKGVTKHLGSNVDEHETGIHAKVIAINRRGAI